MTTPAPPVQMPNQANIVVPEGADGQLERLVALLAGLQASSAPEARWMAGAGWLTCDGGALAAAILADRVGIPVRLCAGLYWHTDASLRAEAMGDYPDPADPAGVNGEEWLAHLRWVARNAMDEHHHWVVLWPDSSAAVLVDPNGPDRREPYVQSLAAEGEHEPAWRLGGLVERYTELAVGNPDRSLVYDPDDDWSEIAEDLYPGLLRAVEDLLAA